MASDLEQAIRLFLRAVAACASYLPDCHAWLTAVVRVAVLLRPHGDRWRSESASQLPGLIFLDVRDGMQVLEGLVHEAAHLHLFLAEATGPLVDPSHTDTYMSPLRPDPRPLRGILLAYHALAYICALYADAVEHGLAGEACERLLASTRQKLLAAESTIVAARSHLTQLGAVFLDRTINVSSYSAT